MATYLVTQATGQQSQWVITHLIAAGVRINALVRNKSKIPAILQHPSVTLFEGESTNYEVVRQAAQDCKSVFLNTFPAPGLESQQVNTVIRAAKDAGIKSLVVSTASKVNDREYWNDEYVKGLGIHWYFEAKYETERLVREAGFESYTILRPLWIIHDFFLPAVSFNILNFASKGELDHAFDEGIKMAYTDAFDIGRYAAAALQDPVKFKNAEIDLRNEAFTIKEVASVLTKVSGRTVTERKRTAEELAAATWTKLSQGLQMLASKKPLVDDKAAVEAVQKKFGIPFTSLEAALSRDVNRLLATIPA